MAISITVLPSLTLDESLGLQNGLDPDLDAGAINPATDDDVAEAYDSTSNQLTGGLADVFEDYIEGLFASGSAAQDTALGFSAAVEAAASAANFITVTANAGETLTNLFFSVTGTGLISTTTSLAGEALYFHVDANTDFATLTTSAAAGGRVVAAFYLNESAFNPVTHTTTAQVQMVTFEPLKHPDGANPDDAINFSDVLRISAAGSTNFTFDNLPSGNFLYAAFGNTTSALLITGDNLSVSRSASKLGEVIKNDSDTVNTSQAAPGTQATIGINSQHFTAGGSGQNLTDGSTADFTFVSGFAPLAGQTVPATGSNVTNIAYTGYINTNGAGIDISQLTGNTPHADLRISVWEAGDLDHNDATALTPETSFSYVDNSIPGGTTDVNDDTALHDDNAIPVVQVKVKHGGTTYTFDNVNGNADDTQAGVTVHFESANAFTVTGLGSFDSVDWTVAAGDTFNRAKIQALSTTNPFDLGGVHINQGSTSSTGLGSHLFVDDDGPSILRNTVERPLLTTDDTSVPASVAGPTSFATLFDAHFGTDGFLDADHNGIEDDGAITFALSLKDGLGTISGLTDTLTGDSILLRVTAGGDVEGYVSSDTTLVAFLIDLNTDTGAITLNQYRAIAHNDPGDPYETGTSAAAMAADLIVLTATIVDNDGDTDTDPAQIGDAFRFEDDGPSITRNTVDRPFLTTDDTGIPTSTSGPTSFATLFDGNFGKDGFKDSDDNNVEDADAISFALSLKSGLGTVSGLTDSVSGDSILLRVNGDGDVEGYLSGATGTLAFLIDLNPDNGDITLTQYRAIVHNDPDDSDEPGTSAATMAADLIVLTATIRDGDGDSDSDPAQIGDAFRFKDDGPNIAPGSAPPELTVDESDFTTNATLSFADAFIKSFGQDGPAASNATTYHLSFNPGLTGLVDSLSGEAVVLGLDGNDVVGLAGSGGDEVFRVSVDADGNVTLDQSRAVMHGDTTDPDDSTTLAADSLITLTATVTDKDGDHDSETVGIARSLNFEDDGPSVTGAAVQATVDDDGGSGGNPGGLGDDPLAPKVVTGSVDALFDGGADGLKSYTISIANLADDPDPPVIHSQGGLVEFAQAGDLVTGYVESGAHTGYQSGEDRDVFTFELNVGAVAGAFRFTLIDQIDQPVAGIEDNLDLHIGILLQAVDNDGDVSSAAAPVELTIHANDDSPVINTPNTTANDAQGSNETITTTGATGAFDFSVGFDDRSGTVYSATNSDLLVSLVSGTVGTAGITVGSTSWVSETDHQATFAFNFTYISNPTTGATTADSGLLAFDKDAGTYTFTLTDPVSSFGILSLATALGFTGYLTNTGTVTGSQPPVTVAALADDFFVQFTGAHETGGGTDGNNTLAKNNNLDALDPTETWTSSNSAVTHDDDAFTNGELFTQSSTWVSVSGTAAGTAGDTMQAGEVLDFNFWNANPSGFLGGNGASRTMTPTMFIEFDGLDNGEDLVVVLKVVDQNGVHDTRAVIVQYDDIFHKAQAGDIPAAFGFTGTLDNNDGLVVIESNDYNNIFAGDAGHTWQIEGAQVVASTEGLTGVGIDLNRTIGDLGGSSATGVFGVVKDSGGNNGGTWDGDVFKIVNIGFLTEVTPNSQFNFNVEAIDFDGDGSGVQSLTVDVAGDASSTLLAASMLYDPVMAMGADRLIALDVQYVV